MNPALLALPLLLAAEPADYARDVKPLLTRRCYACHGALKSKARLRLDTGTWSVLGYEREAPVVLRWNVPAS